MQKWPIVHIRKSIYKAISAVYGVLISIIATYKFDSIPDIIFFNIASKIYHVSIMLYWSFNYFEEYIYVVIVLECKSLKNTICTHDKGSKYLFSE